MILSGLDLSLLPTKNVVAPKERLCLLVNKGIWWRKLVDLRVGKRCNQHRIWNCAKQVHFILLGVFIRIFEYKERVNLNLDRFSRKSRQTCPIYYLHVTQRKKRPQLL